ncbi:MAG TPA: hypothetical protein VIY48_05980 [Candidatus Paceibacterota bacterium]
MAAGASKEQISRYVRKIHKQYGPLRYRVIHASNGEVAVLWYDASTNDWTLNPDVAAKHATHGTPETPYGEQSFR